MEPGSGGGQAPALRAAGRAPYPYLQPAIVTGAMAPAASILLRVLVGKLGANPIAEALNELGLAALILLIGSLACTPLKILFGLSWPARIRRTLGLLAFGYGTLHFLTYAILDQGLAIRRILEDVTKRKFIYVGLGSLCLMVPLAITSTKASVKRLGFRRWKLLHRLVYASGALGAVHFIWRVKKDWTEPGLYAAVLATLLLIRLVAYVRDRRPAAARAMVPATR